MKKRLFWVGVLVTSLLGLLVLSLVFAPSSSKTEVKASPPVSLDQQLNEALDAYLAAPSDETRKEAFLVAFQVYDKFAREMNQADADVLHRFAYEVFTAQTQAVHNVNRIAYTDDQTRLISLVRRKWGEWDRALAQGDEPVPNLHCTC